MNKYSVVDMSDNWNPWFSRGTDYWHRNCTVYNSTQDLFFTCTWDTSHHITLHHIKSHRMTSHHITSHAPNTSHYIISYHIISHHITSHHIISDQITSYHIISSHITSYHIISHHITSSLPRTFELLQPHSDLSRLVHHSWVSLSDGLGGLGVVPFGGHPGCC